MSVLKFKDPQTNEWKEILSIQGPMGPQGPKGEDGFVVFEELTEEQKEMLRGPAGAPGNDGYTPIKGVDYYTTADKNEIVELVKADLATPTASEVSYSGDISSVSNIQSAIDFVYNYAIDSTYLDNILNNAGYQTEEDVIALIQLYGGGENLTPAEEVEF